MVILLAPALAGEGVLNGLRGEFRQEGQKTKNGWKGKTLVRRVEDKLLTMGMQCRNVMVMFDTSGVRGNRTGFIFLKYLCSLFCAFFGETGRSQACCRRGSSCWTLRWGRGRVRSTSAQGTRKGPQKTPTSGPNPISGMTRRAAQQLL